VTGARGSPWPLLGIAAALCTAPVQAAEWVPVGAPDQNQHAYDRSKLTVDGEAITYWRRVVFRSPQPLKAGTARMALYRERIDCRSHSHRTLGCCSWPGRQHQRTFTRCRRRAIPGTVETASRN
jgi:hypothetical protein